MLGYGGRNLAAGVTCGASPGTIGHEPQSAGSAGSGPESAGQGLDAWAYQLNVRLHLIEPGKPAPDAFIESFDGKMADECLHNHLFMSQGQTWATIDA